jgi:aminopeptidase N
VDTPVRRVISPLRDDAGDRLVSSRKIHQPIETKGDIDNAFDNISYGKVGRPLHVRGLGRAEVQRGVRRYLGRTRDA